MQPWLRGLAGAHPEGLGVGCAHAGRPVLLGDSWAQGPPPHWTGVLPNLPLMCSSHGFMGTPGFTAALYLCLL